MLVILKTELFQSECVSVIVDMNTIVIFEIKKVIKNERRCFVLCFENAEYSYEEYYSTEENAKSRLVDLITAKEPAQTGLKKMVDQLIVREKNDNWIMVI